MLVYGFVLFLLIFPMSYYISWKVFNNAMMVPVVGLLTALFMVIYIASDKKRFMLQIFYITIGSFIDVPNDIEFDKIAYHKAVLQLIGVMLASYFSALGIVYYLTQKQTPSNNVVQQVGGFLKKML